MIKFINKIYKYYIMTGKFPLLLCQTKTKTVDVSIWLEISFLLLPIGKNRREIWQLFHSYSIVSSTTVLHFLETEWNLFYFLRFTFIFIFIFSIIPV